MACIHNQTLVVIWAGSHLAKPLLVALRGTKKKVNRKRYFGNTWIYVISKLIAIDNYLIEIQITELYFLIELI